jgi:MFS family permease
VVTTLRRRAARLLADVTPLRESRDFRLLYAGQLVSATGSQMTLVAAPIQVFQLTGSSLAVGLLGLVQIVPLVGGSLVGGALADQHDRRRLLLLAQLLLGVTSLALAVNAVSPAPQVWLIYVLTGLGAGFTGLDLPTRTAAVPTLVRVEILPSALALNQLLWQTCQVVGPAVAGLLIARSGPGVAFGIDALTFAVAAAFVAALRPLRPEGGGTRASARAAGSGGIGRSILEGLRYLRGRRALQGSFLIDINAMVFGMPRALFPEIGLRVFGSAEVAGLLYSAPAAGALIGAGTSGWLHRIERQGRAIVISVMVWGAAIAGFGLTAWLPAALFLLALAGAADVVSAVFRTAVVQTTVPDRLRGRLSAIFIAVVTGGPRLGDVEAGTVAALAGAQVSVVSGGVACIAGALAVAWAMPDLARWRRPVAAAAGPEALGEVAAYEGGP